MSVYFIYYASIIISLNAESLTLFAVMLANLEPYSYLNAYHVSDTSRRLSRKLDLHRHFKLSDNV